MKKTHYSQEEQKRIYLEIIPRLTYAEANMLANITESWTWLMLKGLKKALRKIINGKIQ